MNNIKTISICGGGNLAHVCAGYLAAKKNMEIRVLTRRPQKWSNELEVYDYKGKIYKGTITTISSDPQEVIDGADIALMCLPGFSIAQELAKIKPFLKDKTLVGSIVGSTGFFFEAHKILSKNQPLFAFQRVPFISRIQEYGHSAMLLGYKKALEVATENIEDFDSFHSLMLEMFDLPVKRLKSFYEVSLSNSNPLLHTSRLYNMLKDYKPGIFFASVPDFYSEWTDEDSTLLIAMDAELQQLLRYLDIGRASIKPILEYYEQTDAPSLTKKIASIEAFKGLKAPMKLVEGGYIPDFESRYFTEDFPYGLRYIYELCKKHGIVAPNIDKVYSWGSASLAKKPV